MTRKKGTIPKKHGAPYRNHNARKEIDWNTIDELLRINATAEEIAAYLKVDQDTLTNHCKKEKGVLFSEYIKNGRSDYKVSLRRAQTRKALGYWEESEVPILDSEGRPTKRKRIERKYIPPSDTLLIWLGKQDLGQSDKTETVNRNFNENITLVADDKEMLEQIRSGDFFNDKAISKEHIE